MATVLSTDVTCPPLIGDEIAPLKFKTAPLYRRVFRATELESLLNPPVGNVQDPLDRGRASETAFFHILLSMSTRFKNPEYTTVWEDWKRHVDVRVDHDAKNPGWKCFDVKSPKRALGQVLVNHIWIQLTGAASGGWLNARHVDALAFHLPDDTFVVVDRLELLGLVQRRSSCWPRSAAGVEGSGELIPSGDNAKESDRLRLMPVEEVLRLPLTEVWPCVPAPRARLLSPPPL